MKDAQRKKMGEADGFIAALDQSGGSTPKALGLYGVSSESWSNDEEMFDLVHAMRTRIMTSPSFSGERILAAILFENTMKNTVSGMPTAEYLWSQKQIVPILKVDKGLAEEIDGVQLMKPMSSLNETLASANEHGIFGTKMRSVIKQANGPSIENVVQQQFDIGLQILEAGLVPIIEPEVDITIPDKKEAEDLLYKNIKRRLDRIEPSKKVMLKLSLPEHDNFYEPLTRHPNILRIVALSGGFEKKIAVGRLRQNNKMIASFSRALTEGLKSNSPEKEFEEQLDQTIQSIFEASLT